MGWKVRSKGVEDEAGDYQRDDAQQGLVPVFVRDHRSALSLHDVTQATLCDLRREPAGANSDVPVVMLENGRSAFLTGCFALPKTGVFLPLAGPETAGISLKATDLTAVARAIHVSEGASKQAIRD